MSSPYPEVVLTPYLSRHEAAALMGVSERTIDRYIADGKIAANRVGPRLIRIPLASSEEFIAGGAQ